jgi:hypothetical protein
MRSRFIGLHLLVFVFLCLLTEAQNTSDPSHSAANSKTNSPKNSMRQT